MHRTAISSSAGRCVYPVSEGDTDQYLKAVIIYKRGTVTTLTQGPSSHISSGVRQRGVSQVTLAPAPSTGQTAG